MTNLATAVVSFRSSVKPFSVYIFHSSVHTLGHFYEVAHNHRLISVLCCLAYTVDHCSFFKFWFEKPLSNFESQLITQNTAFYTIILWKLILRDRWTILRDHFGFSKRFQKTLVPMITAESMLSKRPVLKLVEF